jgi:hypothetical protein
MVYLERTVEFEIGESRRIRMKTRKFADWQSAEQALKFYEESGILLTVFARIYRKESKREIPLITYTRRDDKLQRAVKWTPKPGQFLAVA